MTFLSENPDELCNRLHLKTQEEHGAIDTAGFDDETVALIDELLEYKSIIKTQLKYVLFNFTLSKRFCYLKKM